VIAAAVAVVPPLFVAPEAGLLLGQGVEHAVATAVDAVAGRARQILRLVHAAKPAEAAARLVAAQADRILFRGRLGALQAENNSGQDISATPLAARMVLAGPVAGFALELPEGRAWIVQGGVWRVEYRHG
jgi:hypothetical protein